MNSGDLSLCLFDDPKVLLPTFTRDYIQTQVTDATGPVTQRCHIFTNYHCHRSLGEKGPYRRSAGRLSAIPFSPI